MDAAHSAAVLEGRRHLVEAVNLRARLTEAEAYARSQTQSMDAWAGKAAAEQGRAEFQETAARHWEAKAKVYEEGEATVADGYIHLLRDNKAERARADKAEADRVKSFEAWKEESNRADDAVTAKLRAEAALAEARSQMETDFGRMDADAREIATLRAALGEAT